MTTNCHYRDLSELFHKTTSTISAVFHQVLKAVVGAAPEVIRPAKAHDRVVLRARGKRYWPWFDRCVGVLDGSHILAHVVGEQAAFRNRKGVLTQNVLAVVDHRMRFTYVLAGWEGSAHDSRVLASARSSHGLECPEDCYYLGDAGYPLNDITLVPYRGVRYYLREQYVANLKPRNYKELFNLRHSSVRNVVERACSVLKRRFRIFETAPQFQSIGTQRDVVYACVALHNILIESGSALPAEIPLAADDTNTRGDNPAAAEREDMEPKSSMALMRDDIAMRMWHAYQEDLDSEGEESA